MPEKSGLGRSLEVKNTDLRCFTFNLTIQISQQMSQMSSTPVMSSMQLIKLGGKNDSRHI